MSATHLRRLAFVWKCGGHTKQKSNSRLPGKHGAAFAFVTMSDVAATTTKQKQPQTPRRYRVDACTELSPETKRVCAIQSPPSGAQLTIDMHTVLMPMAVGDEFLLQFDSGLEYAGNATVINAEPRGFLASCGGMVLLATETEHSFSAGQTFSFSISRHTDTQKKATQAPPLRRSKRTR